MKILTRVSHHFSGRLQMTMTVRQKAWMNERKLENAGITDV